MADAVQDARNRFAAMSGLNRLRGLRQQAAVDLSHSDHEAILNRVLEEIRGEIVTEPDIARVSTAYNTRMSGSLRIDRCGACGISIIGEEIKNTPLDALGTLEIPDSLLVPASTRWTLNGKTLAMHPPLNADWQQNLSVCMCSTCHNDVTHGKVPEYSVRDGYDFGILPDLPRLSLLEIALLAPGRMFAQVVKLIPPVNDPTCTQFACTGHVITFPHDAPTNVARFLALNEPSLLAQTISLKFIGTRGQWDIVQSRLGTNEFDGLLACRDNVLRRWFTFLKRNNDVYADIVVDEILFSQERLDTIVRMVIDATNVVDDPIVSAQVHRTQQEPAQTSNETRANQEKCLWRVSRCSKRDMYSAKRKRGWRCSKVA